MTTSVETQTLIRVGDRLALVLDDAVLARLGITADTPVRVTETGGMLMLTPQANPEREAKFATALDTMAKRYERTLRRLAE